jgi:hypothetical protein
MSLFKATDATTNAIHADADLGIRVHNLLEPDDLIDETRRIG